MEPLTLEELREHEAHLAAVCEPDEDYPEDIVAKKALRAVRELIALRERNDLLEKAYTGAQELHQAAENRAYEAQMAAVDDRLAYGELLARHQRLREAAVEAEEEYSRAIAQGYPPLEKMPVLRAALQEDK